MSNPINPYHWDCCKLDIEFHDKPTCPEESWIQGRFLVHGLDDVLWTDDVEDVVNMIRAELERLVTP